MSRYVAPNQEPEVVLKCGCITGNEFAFKHIGQAGEYQICPLGHTGDGRYGTVKILRKATVYELIQWRTSGTPAPRRRSSKAPEWLSAMSGEPLKKASAKPRRQSDTLF